MSTLRTDTLQTTDSIITIPLSDIASKTALANSSNPALGAGLIGYNGSTVAAALNGVIDQKIIYADNPIYGGNLATAVAALTDYSTLVIRQAYTTTAPLRIVGKTGVVVCCTGAGKINGSRTAFTFPTADARGILHFDSCVNSVAYRMNIVGARTAKSSFGADVKTDGDAGIEHIRSTSPRTIECKVDQVLTWGVIHIGCTDTKTLDCTLTNMTRQSGVGHATVNGGLVRGCFVNYSGLYGIEVEGTGNTDIHVHNNIVRNCLSGIAVIGAVNSCEVKQNLVSLCTYLIQANANGASNTQVGTEFSGNRLYDGLYHVYLADTTFVDVVGNSSLGRVAGAYLPQRPADHVVRVLSSTQVLILDSTSGTILAGDNHYYSEGVLRTVQTVGTQVDATYGSCWLVTYNTADTSTGFGSFFLRNTNFVNAGAWAILLGTRNAGLNIAQNTVNAPVAYGLSLGGNANAVRWIDNRMVGVNVGYYAADATAITNSSIICGRGDIQQPSTSIFGGSFVQKILPSMVGTMRTANMASQNKPINLTSFGSSVAFRLRVNVYGSTKTASTGNAVISVNGTAVDTIPVATLGTQLIQRDIMLNLPAATSYTLNIADTFGDMTFSSASFELHTVEA